ncbi:MAG: mechanosensitive ion channel [Desulfobacteraceae bacterium]|jgi:small-conductance mechanosensitive channel
MKLTKLLFFVSALIWASFDIVYAVGAADDVLNGIIEKEQPTISISEEMGDAMVREAARVKEQIRKSASSMFKREPLGWDLRTIDYLYKWVLGLPMMIPTFMLVVMEQSRVLGFVGSILVLTFLVALFYSVFGRKKIMARIETAVEPVRDKLPEVVYPFFISAVRIIVAALFPLVLLAIYLLINAMIDYQVSWFLLTGRLLVLWAFGALIINSLRETLTRGLFTVTVAYGMTIFRLTRLAVLYAIFGIALFWAADVYSLRPDALALLRFSVSISIVLVLFSLFLKKRAMLSLLPELPYKTYSGFARQLRRHYFLLIFFSLIVALLWCVGYRLLGSTVLLKVWSTGTAYVGIMIAFHLVLGWLYRWQKRTRSGDETAQFLYRSFKSVLVYATVLATAMILLNLLGLLRPLQQLMSFPVFQLGDNSVTCWTILKAILILISFIYFSRLLQAYLDYKVYPTVGVDPGLGYALNTFLKYLLAVVGVLTSLRVVGVDLRFLFVFAGAIGLVIGLGLQNMAANVISGFSIIFGGKIRKGDWIEVGDTMGMVTDIYLRATKVRTRDNIEYLIPNSDFISGVVVNFSLSSPLIRLELPVGVSYDADPRQVEEILIEAAKEEPMVADYREPGVRFTDYGDNAINFVLLFWVDVRRTARRRVKSALYFRIFDGLKKAGIDIPYPQRELHLRSGGLVAQP